MSDALITGHADPHLSLNLGDIAHRSDCSRTAHIERPTRPSAIACGRVHVVSAIFYFSYPFISSVKHPVSRMTSTRDQVCVLTGVMSYGSFRTYISPTPSLCKISKDPLIYTPSSWTHGSAATTDSTKLRIQSSRREKARSMSAPARSLYIGRPMLLNAVGGYRGRPNPDKLSDSAEPRTSWLG